MLHGEAELRPRYRVQYSDAPSSSQDVDDGVLEESDEDEDETHGHPNVDRLDVRHSR